VGSVKSTNPRLDETSELARDGKHNHLAAPGVVVGVAERGEEDLDAHFAGLRRRHLHVLDHHRLVGLISHGRCTQANTMNPPITDQTESSEKQRPFSALHPRPPMKKNRADGIKQITFAGDDLTLGGGIHCFLGDLGVWW
jgi:hypothetical protein